jgi:hypothetical protein
MEAHPEAAITGTQTAVLSSENYSCPPLPGDCRVKEISFTCLLLINRLFTRTIIIRADLPHRFLPGKRYSEDYLLWLSIIADGHRAFLLEVPLAYSFKRDFGVGGLSADLWKFHREVMDTYHRLYLAGHISVMTRTLLGLYSFLKLVRRWTLSIN